MPYGITQCYLPPDRDENPAFTPQPKQVLDLATRTDAKLSWTRNLWIASPMPYCWATTQHKTCKVGCNVLAHVLLRITPFLGESGPHLTLGYLDPLELAPPSPNGISIGQLFLHRSLTCRRQKICAQPPENMPTDCVLCINITAENMEESQHTNFKKDTTNESASVACSNVRLWKLDTQKEWRSTSWRLWDERAEKDFSGIVDSTENKWVGS